MYKNLKNNVKEESSRFGSAKSQRVEYYHKKLWQKMTAWLCVSVLVFQPLMVSAGVVVDKAAAANNRPTLDRAANGVGIVNVARPNDKGVSHNVFTEFNVNKDGLILNNSRVITNTQLGGHIAGNANFGEANARLILNEVTGRNRSDLRGQTEIAGQAADYVLANPYGITCDGCGFINTPRVTLAAGAPELHNGQLRSFNVDNGSFIVQGMGLNASNVKHLDIIARSAQINAQLHAQKLMMVLGKNNVDYATGRATSLLKESESSDAPEFALDVAALGGMYVNAISMMGTERGVGVRVAGDMAAATGDMTLTADGKISINKASAKERIAISSFSSDVDITNNLHANIIDVTAAETLTIKGDITSGLSEVDIRAKNIITDTKILTGFDNNGHYQKDGLFLAIAQNSWINSGDVLSTGSINVTTHNLLNNPGALIQADNNLLLRAASVINQSAIIAAGKELHLSVADYFDNSEGAVFSNSHNINLSARDFNNTAGQISAGGDVHLEISKELNNAAGNISAGAGVVIEGEGTLVNAGGNIASSDSQLNLQGIFDNQNSSYVRDDADLVLNLGGLDNRDGYIFHSGTGVFDLNISGIFDNRSGQFGSDGSLDVAAQSLLNDDGILYGKKLLNLQITQDISNLRGYLSSDGELSVYSQRLNNNNGKIFQAGTGRLEISATVIDNSFGQIASNIALQLTHDLLTNHEGSLTAESIIIRGENLDNSNGTIDADMLDIELTGNLLNDGDAHLVAQGSGDNSLAISIEGLLSNGGLIGTNAQAAHVVAGDFNNSGRLLHAGEGVFQLDVLGQLINSNRMDSNGNFLIHTNSLKNSHLIFGDELSIQADVGLDNRDGTLESQTAIKVLAENLDNSGGVILASGAGDSEIVIEKTLENSSGIIQTNANNLVISAEEIRNSNGKLLHAGNGQLFVSAEKLENNNGQIASNNTLAVNIFDVNNRGGSLGAATVNLTGTNLDNSAGIIDADRLQINLAGNLLNDAQGQLIALGTEIDALLLNIQGLLDNQGYIGTNAQQASIHANSMINSGHLLHAGFGVLRINVSESLHNTGALESGGNITADAQTLQNSNRFVSTGDMTLSAVKIINSHTFDSSGAINITATDFDNRGGILTAAGIGESQITIANELNNQAGVIQTNADQFVIAANQINNDAGNILHAGNGVLQISADQLSNHTGAIASNRQMQIIAQDINNNSGSLTAAQINITGNNLNNSGGSIDADQLQILLTGNLLNLTTATNAYISALDTAPGSLILRADGQLENSGVIQTNAESGSISAGNFINTGHVLHAGTGVLRLEAQTGFLNNSRIDSNGDQHIFADDLTNQGFITSVGDLDITVQQALNNSGDLDAGGAIVIAASDLDNTNGFITSAGTADSAINLSGLLINNNGVIQSNATNFSITAHQLSNTNKAAIKHAGTGQLDMNVADTFVNTDAQITANAKIITNTDSFDNREGKISAQTVLIDAHHLDNSGGTLDSDRLQIELSGNLTNNIGTHNNLEGLITALGINPDDLWLNVAGSLENYGIIQTRAQSAYIVADTLENHHSIYHVGVGVLQLDVQNTLTNSGTLESNGQLSVDADTLVNTNGLIASTGILDLAIESLLNNSFGHIDSGEAIKIRAGEFVNQQGYVVSAGTGNLDWSVIGSLDNTDGIIESNADVMLLTANELHNEAGRITHAGGGQLDINATESINNKSGIVESTAAIKLASQNIDNQQGDIYANNISAIGEVLNNTDGVIEADKLTLQLTRLDNIKTAASQRGIISALGADANSLIINVAGGVNNSGVIQTNAQSGELNAKAITNTGEIIHAGLGVLRLKADGAFTNNAGKLISLGALDLNLGSLVNTNGGAIVADKSLALKAQTGITNDAAQIGSAQALTINVVAGNLINSNAAKILSNGGNSLINVSGNLNNQNGIIGVEGTKSSISVGSSLNNRAGIIKHLGNGELSIKAGSIDNSGGDLLGDDRLLLTQFNQLINNLLNGKAGNITASHISIDGTTLNNTDGEIFASGLNSLDINVDTINNTRGDLYSLGDVTIDAKTISNTNGTIQSEKTLTLNLPSFNLSNGLFNAANSLIINTTGDLTNGEGNQLLTSGNLSLNTTGTITNYGTLSALGDLGLKGAGLINGRSDIAAVVSAGNLLNLNFTGAINNYGQLSGTNGFTLFSQALNNHKGALVSGGDLTATVSGNINNYSLIFAADNLNLFTVNQMNNYTQANIFSLNNIVIAKNSSLASNTQVLNQSGTIEAFGGDLSIYTGVLKNQRESYTTDVNGNVLTNSGAASIMAGGNMALRANSIHNSISMIAADGDLHMQGGSLINEAYSFGYDTREEYYRYLGGSDIDCYDNGYCNVRSYGGGLKAGMIHGFVTAQVIQMGAYKGAVFVLDTIAFDGNRILFANGRNLDNLAPREEVDFNLNHQSVFDSYINGIYESDACSNYVSCYWDENPTLSPDSNDWETIPSYEDTPTRKSIPLGFFFSDQVWHDSFETVASTIQAGGTLSGNFTGTLENVNLQRKLDGSVSETRNAFVLADHSNVSNAATHDRQNANIKASGRDLAAAPTNTAPSIDTSINTNASVENINNTTEKNIISGAGGKSLDRSLESVDQVASNNGAATIDSSRENVNSATSQAGAGTVTGNKTTVENADGSNESVALDSTGPGNVPSVPAGGTTLTPITNPTPDVNPIVISYNPAQNLELPTNKGMFVVNTDPQSQYLVETNPLLTNYLDFIGTDYLLDRLGFDPADLKRRLGDAFYETRLLRDGIFETFGQRYLTDQNTGLAFTSDEAQFRYLMDNAIAANEALHLSVGVELSAEQVARLTHDIVWLVEQEVNGEKVLVPMYYASAARAGDLDNKGALIAGQSVNLSADQGITNTGNLRGVHDLTLRTQQALRNTGNISAENFVILDAGSITNTRDKIGNSGSIVSGREGSLTLIARSGDINNDSRIAGGDVRLESEIGSITNSGSLNAQRDLVAIAQRDIINTVVTDNTGERVGSIESGRNLSLITREGDISNRATITTDSAHGHTTRVTVGTAPRINAGGDMTLDSGRDVLLTASNLRSGNDMTLNAARDIRVENAANESHFVGKDYNGKTNQSSRVEHVGSSLDAGGDMTMNAGRDAHLLGTEVTAQGNVALNAERDLNLEAVADSSHSETHRKRYDRVDSTVTHVQTTITAGADASLKAGQDINMIGSTLTAQGDASLHAERDTNLVAVNDSEYHYEYEKKKKSFGRSKTSLDETLHTENIGSAVIAGGNLTVNAALNADDGSIALQESRNVLLHGSTLQGGGDVIVGAGENILITANTEEHLEVHEKKKSGLGGLTGKGRSDTAAQTIQIGSLIDAGADAVLLSGNNLAVAGSTIAADNSVELHAGLVNETGNLNILALQDDSFSESKTHKKSFGLDISSDFVSFSKERENSSDGTASTNAASVILAGNNITGNAAQDINVVGSILDAGNNLTLDSGRNVMITAGKNAESAGSEQKNRRDGIGLDGDDNGVSVFAGNETRSDREQVNQNTVAASVLNAGNDVTVNAGHDVNVSGSDVNAGRNLNLTAVNNVTINASQEQLDSETKSSFTRDGLTVTSNHNIGQAIEALGDIGQGDNAVSDASGVMKAMDAMNNVGPSGSAFLGQTTTSDKQQTQQTNARGSNLSAGGNVIVDAGNTTNINATNINAGRDIGIYGTDVRIDDAQNTQTTNTVHDYQQVGVTLQASQGNASLTAGFSKAESDLEQVAITTTGSSFTAGQDIDIHATNDLSITGSDLTAERNIRLQGDNDVTIQAGQGYTTSTLDEEHLSAGAGINFGTNGIGVTAYVAAGENDLDRENVEHRNSHITANENLTVISGNDTTISGANLHAKNLDMDVGNNLHVESLQDTGNVEGKRWDASGSITVGAGVSGGASVGYGETDGSRAWVTEQTSLIGTESVNIKVGSHTQVDGALIANLREDGTDGGNLNLDTRTLGFSDLQDHDKEESNYLSVGFSTGGDSGANANTGASPDSEGNSWKVEGSHYELDREQITRATFGQGNVTVREDEQTGNDSTANLNRDTQLAQEVTKDKERDIDLYVSSTAIDSAKNLTADGDQNTLSQWKDNVTSVADPDAYRQMLNNVEQLNNPEAISEAWNNLVSDMADSMGLTPPEISAEEFEQQVRLPEINPSLPGSLSPQLQQPTEKDLLLLASIKVLRDQAVESGEPGLIGSIDWDYVVKLAWDFENAGPTAVLKMLNDQVSATSLNDLKNINLLRAEVENLNAVATNFDNTVGMAANIATMGSAAYRVGAVIGENIGTTPATRQARELLDDAKSWLNQGDEAVDAGRTANNAGGDAATPTREIDIRAAIDGEMIGQPFTLPQSAENIAGTNIRSVLPVEANGTYPKPAYNPDFPIFDFDADGATAYVRVFANGKNSASGAWMMRAEDIKSLSPEQIQQQFDLPSLPTSIVDVMPPKGTQIRTGTVNTSNFGGDGGRVQFQLLDNYDSTWFKNPRDLK